MRFTKSIRLKCESFDRTIEVPAASTKAFREIRAAVRSRLLIKVLILMQKRAIDVRTSRIAGEKTYGTFPLFRDYR